MDDGRRPVCEADGGPTHKLAHMLLPPSFLQLPQPTGTLCWLDVGAVVAVAAEQTAA